MLANKIKSYDLESCENQLSVELTSMDVVDEFEDIRYTTYGLRVLDLSGNVLYSAPDIGTKRAFVEQFIEFCAAIDVRLVHIHDLLKDYIEAKR